jgi:hypothetical protein
MLRIFRAPALLVCLAPAWAAAATLYQWTDPSGETRYGYRPPPGVVGTVVGEKIRPTSEPAKPVNCRELQDEHLRLIDKEIARLRSLPTGLGTEFEFTAEAKQRFINDLLAHRAALITGRAPQEFAAPDSRREVGDLQAKYNKDKAKLMEDLEAQARQLQKQRAELDRQRRENESMLLRYRFYPGLLY